MIMKCRELIITIALLFPILLVYAKDKADIWHHGMINLKTNEILSGDIYYHYEDDMVIYKSGKILKTYSAYQVESFSFYDKKIKKERQFKAYDLNNKGSNFEFFEVVTSGNLKLLRKEKPMLIPSGDYYYFFANQNETGNHKTHFVYYLLKDDDLMKVKNFKKQLFNLTEKLYQDMIKDYIQDENLKLDQVNSQVKLLTYYNQLKDSERLFTGIKR